MRRPVLSLAVIAIIAVILASGPVLAQGGPKKISEVLTGYEEFPPLSTPGGGRFSARIANDGSAIAWELSYSDLESTVDQAHIHFENPTNNGPIVVFLCTNLGNGPAGTAACPPQPATVSGVIEAVDVLGGGAAQGIAAGELAELIRAIRAGSTYVNVHTAVRTGGEIRAQLHIHPGRGPQR
jgi:hypothetical protein